MAKQTTITVGDYRLRQYDRRNLAEEPEDFRCSACGGMKFDIFAARYCPDCGAEIIVS